MFVELVLPDPLPVDRDEVEDAVVEQMGAECTGAGGGVGILNLDLEFDQAQPDNVVAGLRSLLAGLGIAGASANIEGFGRVEL